MNSDGDVSTARPGPSAPRRFARWHAGLSAADKFGLYGVLCAVLPLLIAGVTWLGQSVAPPSPVAMLVEEVVDACSTEWLLTPKGRYLAAGFQGGDDRQLARWQREGLSVHKDAMTVEVSLRGNADKAVEIRDLSLNVTRRGRPVAGTPPRVMGCGGPESPERMMVDLDTLPVGRDIPVSYLQRSPHQRAARKAATEYGGELITLPRQVTTDTFYRFELIARTQRFDSEWTATITWWDGEEVHHDRIDNSGRAFRVSAGTVAGSYTHLTLPTNSLV
ncbi:hypothetical protein [Streptomyces sp. MZ04]|uniref:hypothetical protein n=1 Tax=Streptomyces sp. MZ04 TaxID=2559236 RepID=UPI00107E9339|nr:hypothetical protein [Streptomyces sp. MZ04]TGA83950.1 hypothetical protein E2651_42895 [Streptomyces sp. MZ04]